MQLFSVQGVLIWYLPVSVSLSSMHICSHHNFLELQVLYVPPPDAQGRHEILRIHTRKMKLGEDVSLGEIAERTELFTGADLEGLCREAGMAALRADLSASSIHKAHFEAAIRSLRPSLTKAEVDEYAAAAIHGSSARKN